ncbi:MAG: hypothetical protein KGN84_14580, partial [Acidobacteriota bacterium]|nr:hypothetical protein [Acidobacteriota bacterium]
MDLQEQLAYLRRTITQTAARADDKYLGNSVGKYPTAAPESRDFDTPPESRGFIEDLLTGEVVETPHGRHFETEKLYASHKRHGSYDIGDLYELRPDILSALS